jgi:5-enolpyruvylshikimate-3-phosphate synthase
VRLRVRPGNSDTTARLRMEVLAGQPFWTMMTGAESLRRRLAGQTAIAVDE